jgi:hypothetical protein
LNRFFLQGCMATQWTSANAATRISWTMQERLLIWGCCSTKRTSTPFTSAFSFWIYFEASWICWMNPSETTSYTNHHCSNFPATQSVAPIFFIPQSTLSTLIPPVFFSNKNRKGAGRTVWR